MQIKTLQKKYVQKSRLFLYPHLGVRKGYSIKPKQTYLSWENVYDFKDNMFIVTYDLRDDYEFKQFEKTHLLKNKRFIDFFELEDGLGAYVFNFNDVAEDFKNVTLGKYSKLSKAYKNVILDFYKKQINHKIRLESYLEPVDHVADYSKLLNVDVKLLKAVGELCDVPDPEKETLRVSKKIITFTKNQ